MKHFKECLSSGIKGRKGFTLIEMLIVVAIIVALIGIVGFSTIRTAHNSRVATVQTSMGNITEALLLNAQDNSGTLLAAPTAGAKFSDWVAAAGTGATLGKYINTLPTNPFFAARIVYIAGSASLTVPNLLPDTVPSEAASLRAMDGTTASTATNPDMILAEAAGVTTGIVHFTLYYKIGDVVYGIQDSQDQT